MQCDDGILDRVQNIRALLERKEMQMTFYSSREVAEIKIELKCRTKACELRLCRR